MMSFVDAFAECVEQKERETQQNPMKRHLTVVQTINVGTSLCNNDQKNHNNRRSYPIKIQRVQRLPWCTNNKLSCTQQSQPPTMKCNGLLVNNKHEHKCKHKHTIIQSFLCSRTNTININTNRVRFANQ